MCLCITGFDIDLITSLSCYGFFNCSHQLEAQREECNGFLTGHFQFLMFERSTRSSELTLIVGLWCWICCFFMIFVLI